MIRWARQTESCSQKVYASRKAKKKGTIITEDLLTLKKPGTGIQKAEMSEVIGKRLKRDWPHDRLLVWDALKWNEEGLCCRK